MKLTNTQYNFVKWVVLTALPALAVAVGAIGGELHVAWIGTAVMIINILDTLIGTLTGVSSQKYNKLEEK